MHKLNDLKIWHKAIELATEVYKATAHFPREETFGLTAQIRRSAVSVSSNIAEGAGRNTNNDFKHFLAIANGFILRASDTDHDSTKPAVNTK